MAKAFVSSATTGLDVTLVSLASEALRSARLSTTTNNNTSEVQTSRIERPGKASVLLSLPLLPALSGAPTRPSLYQKVIQHRSRGDMDSVVVQDHAAKRYAARADSYAAEISELLSRAHLGFSNAPALQVVSASHSVLGTLASLTSGASHPRFVGAPLASIPSHAAKCLNTNMSSGSSVGLEQTRFDQALHNASNVVHAEHTDDGTEASSQPLQRHPRMLFTLEARARVALEGATAAAAATLATRSAAATSATRVAVELQDPAALLAAAKADYDTRCFTPLTDEEDELVYDAACNLSRPENEILIMQYGIPITRRHARTLGPGAWLNDEVSNFYLELIKKRHTSLMTAREAEIATTPPTVSLAPIRPAYFPNTFFYSKLTEDTKEKGKVLDEGYCYANVQRWTRRLGYSVFACDFCIVPLNFSNTHWATAILRPQARTITVYDSFGYNQRCRAVSETLLRWLRDEWADKPLQGYNFQSDEWQHLRPPSSAPRQLNGVDCGVFMLMFADYLARGFEPDFKQRDIPLFRKRIMLAILRNELR